MSEIHELAPADLAFLERYLPPNGSLDTSVADPDRPGLRSELPFVTLTYASSLDSMIALAPGARTTLSGPETKAMTHLLRLRHDAILVGAGTAVVDDPGLNCRYPGFTLEEQPRPIIIDPQGRSDLQGRKVCQLAAEGKGKAPWIFTMNQDVQTAHLESLGGEYVVAPREGLQDSQISWPYILRALKSKGINSVMIEGGASVINTLLMMPELIDACIVTIAPTWLGKEGVNVSPRSRQADGQRTNSAWLRQTAWRQFGNDVVLCGRLQR